MTSMAQIMGAQDALANQQKVVRAPKTPEGSLWSLIGFVLFIVAGYAGLRYQSWPVAIGVFLAGFVLASAAVRVLSHLFDGTMGWLLKLAIMGGTIYAVARGLAWLHWANHEIWR